MLSIVTALALAAAAQIAPAAPATHPHAQHPQTGQHGQAGQTGQVDHSKMDHSTMDHSHMAQHGGGCCKPTADGRMECAVPNKAGTGSGHQDHSGQ